MNTRVYQKSFGGGEIAPEMFGRIDDVKYQNGAAKMRNFVVKPQGAAKFRPGLEYRSSTNRANDVRTTKSRIIPFSFSLTQSVIVELRAWDEVNAAGNYGTIRIHSDSGILQHAAASPYIEPTLVTFSQQSTSLRVNSASWTGTPPATPPFTPNQTVTFRATSGTLPTGLVAGQVYYVNYTGTNDGQGFCISETLGGGNVPWVNAGSGSIYIDATYAVGDLVTRGDDTYLAVLDVTSSVGVQNPSNTSSQAHWFQQFESNLELRHTYTETELFELTYTQSFDVITLAHPNHPVREIRRYGPQKWTLIESKFNDLASPQNVTVVSDYGLGIIANYIAYEDVAGASYGSSTTAVLYSQDTVPPLSAGELVYIRAPGFPYINNRFCVVDVNTQTPSGSNSSTSNARKISLRELVSGTSLPFQFAATSNGTGTWTVTAASLTYATNNNYSLFSGTQPLIQNGRYLFYGTDGNYTIEYYRFANVNTGSGTFTVEKSSNLGTTWTAIANVTNGTTRAFWPSIAGGTTGYVNRITDATRANVAIVQPTSAIQDSQNLYRVCAVYGSLEGPPSATVTATNNLLATGSKNTLSWTTVSGATSYNVYKEVSGLFGYIGRTTTTSFIDDNITPDFSKTTPYVETVFNQEGLYPGAVAYFDQRKCFAGAYDEPNRLIMSRSFTENDFSYSVPSNDTDRLDVEVAAREANRIRHIVPLGELLLLTNATEWRISPVNSEALTPSTISARPQSYIGANSVQPVIVNNSAIFCAARGGHVREMGFNFQAQGFVTGDLSLRAPHLFDDFELVDMAYQKAPIPVLWTVSTSGKLLGLTYVPEEQVAAWHQHDTDGVFESVAVIPSGEEDRLWAVVKRTINGTDVRYIERMAPMQLGDIEDGIYSDSAKVVTLSPAGTSVTGLSHLEGKTVCVLADGVVQTKKTVSGGAITLDSAAATVIVGLPVQAELQTTPIAMQIDGMAQGRVKAINKAWIKLYRSVGLNVGPSGSLTVPSYPYDATGGEKTEEIDVTLLPAWQRYGQVLLKHSEPVPLSVLGMTYEVAVGG